VQARPLVAREVEAAAEPNELEQLLEVLGKGSGGGSTFSISSFTCAACTSASSAIRSNFKALAPWPLSASRAATRRLSDAFSSSARAAAHSAVSVPMAWESTSASIAYRWPTRQWKLGTPPASTSHSVPWHSGQVKAVSCPGLSSPTSTGARSGCRSTTSPFFLASERSATTLSSSPGSSSSGTT
jgi:hypothetical protein